MLDMSHVAGKAAETRTVPGFIVREPRHACRLVARLRLAHGEVGCTVINLSQGGAAIEVDAVMGLAVGQKVTVASTALGAVGGWVRWKSGVRHGIQFDDPARQSQPLAACVAALAAKEPRI